MFPSSAFFRRIVPETGARIVQLSSAPLCLDHIRFGLFDLGAGKLDSLLAWPFDHQVVGVSESIDLSIHANKICFGNVVLTRGKCISDSQSFVPVELRLELCELGFCFLHLGFCLFDLLGAIARFDLE